MHLGLDSHRQVPHVDEAGEFEGRHTNQACHKSGIALPNTTKLHHIFIGDKSCTVILANSDLDMGSLQLNALYPILF